MRTVTTRTLALAAISALAVAVQAVTFTNVTMTGSLVSVPPDSFTTNANSISFFFNNANVGDLSPTRLGNVLIQYDACVDPGQSMTVDQVTINALGGLLGSGTIDFNEQVFQLDDVTMQEGPLVGSLHDVITAGELPYHNEIDLTLASECIRVKKTFTLTAADTGAVDVASLGLVNQSLTVVPEPTSMAVLGLGALAMLRRRRKA